MTTAIRQTMTRGDWALLATLSALWGGSFFFNSIAGQALPPFTVVSLRVGLAAVILVALIRVTGRALPRGWRVWRVLFGMGLINNVIPFSLIVWGQTQVPSGLAAVLNATTPFWTALVVNFLTNDEKLTAAKVTGIAIGVAGVGVLIGPQVFWDFGSHGLGEFAILLATLSYGFSGALGRRLPRLGVEPMTAASGQMIAATTMMVPLALVFDRPWTLALPGWPVWGAILGLAALSTALGYILFFRLMARAGATNTSLVTLLVPVSAILLGTLVLGETLAPKHLAGMALIGAGLLAFDGRAWRWVRGRRVVEAG
ncbi:DMT family transporter [Kaistia nematophila]|uniref:DMT family transporter n=1 Tax=Kaistia nematophila TaxID=2994654 RepID=A0A9X3E5E5_9HYPH|nr:DMT family transporter [Kaistia nematophila]MCX5572184.1 DMT family transporter [Kaistia nematophila]